MARLAEISRSAAQPIGPMILRDGKAVITLYLPAAEPAKPAPNKPASKRCYRVLLNPPWLRVIEAMELFFCQLECQMNGRLSPGSGATF